MHEREIHWPALILSALLLGFVELAAETAGLWGRFPFRPDWFWCLAILAALGARPLPAILAFAACGLTRDLLIGPRVGAAFLAFTGVGWLILNWAAAAPEPGWLAKFLTAGVGATLAACLRLALEATGGDSVNWDSLFLLALGQGALTLSAQGPAILFFSLTGFRPWRARPG